MSFFHVIFMLFAESFARETQVSHTWNSTDGVPCTAERPCTYHDLMNEKVAILLKQGLKIGYLPPSRYNCKFIYEDLIKLI